MSLRSMSQLVKLPFLCGFFPPTLKEYSFVIKRQRNRNSFSLFWGKSNGRSFYMAILKVHMTFSQLKLCILHVWDAVSLPDSWIDGQVQVSVDSGQ